MYRQDEPEVNLERLLEKLRSFGSKLKIGGGGGVFVYVALGVLAVALVVWLSTGFYQVQPGEQAALRLFGKFDTLQDEGLHWFWPGPIGARDIVRIDEVRSLELGVRGDTKILSESLMITGDEDEEGAPGEAPNIVDVQLLVQYDIKDIEQFLFKVVDPDGATIKDVAETSLRQVIGSRPIDDVLTDKKEDIQAETKLLLQRLLDDYEAGINVREVKLLNVFAPVQVQAAFDDVVKAKEDKARVINLADAYKEDILPRARGAAARLLEDAEAFRQERIALATGQAERFTAILTEYRESEDVTRQRLYFEAMEEILPGITKLIVQDENVVVLLPGEGSRSPVLPLPDVGTTP